MVGLAPERNGNQKMLLTYIEGDIDSSADGGRIVAKERSGDARGLRHDGARSRHGNGIGSKIGHP